MTPCQSCDLLMASYLGHCRIASPVIYWPAVNGCVVGGCGLVDWWSNSDRFSPIIIVTRIVCNMHKELSFSLYFIWNSEVLWNVVILALIIVVKPQRLNNINFALDLINMNEMNAFVNDIPVHVCQIWWLEKLHLYTTVVAISTGLQLHVHVHVLTNVSDSPFSL